MRARRMVINTCRKSTRNSAVPYGDYCYKLISIEDGVFKIKPCKYWQRLPDNRVKCKLLNTEGWLIWDQVKECCINE